MRSIGDSDPFRLDPVPRAAGALHEERRTTRSGRVAAGTLACRRCDAPVALTAGPVGPADLLDCPYCSHRAPVRDFLSLATPTRPARVEVRVVDRVRHALR